jgi:hypothetical protein
LGLRLCFITSDVFAIHSPAVPEPVYAVFGTRGPWLSCVFWRTMARKVKMIPDYNLQFGWQIGGECSGDASQSPGDAS